MNTENQTDHHSYRILVAVIYATVLFLDRLDLTIVNITLPTLAKFFNVPITQTEWVTNAFLFALAMSIPVSGWLADRFGDKRVFMASTLLFGLASFLCAYSPSLNTMIFFRFLQGIGGGIIIPVGMGMVYSVFDHSEYASVTSFIFLPTLIAPAVAPFLGGMIIALSSWQWVFLFATPICLVAVMLAAIFLRENDTTITKPFDCIGFITASLSLILLLYAISLFGKGGYLFTTLASVSASLILGYIFYQHETKTDHPLFEVHFFKNRLFMQVNLIQIAFQMCHFGSIFLIGMYLQVGVGMSAAISGLIMGSQAVGAMMTTRYSVSLFNRYGPSIPIITGFVGIIVFTSLILLITTKEMVALGVLILFMRGIFSGLCGTPIQTASIIGFERKDVSRASALFNAGRQISISLGVAVSTVFIAYGFHRVGLNPTTDNHVLGLAIFYPAFIVQAVVAVIGILFTLQIDVGGQQQYFALRKA